MVAQSVHDVFGTRLHAVDTAGNHVMVAGSGNANAHLFGKLLVQRQKPHGCLHCLCEQVYMEGKQLAYIDPGRWQQLHESGQLLSDHPDKRKIEQMNFHSDHGLAECRIVEAGGLPDD